MGKRRRNIPGKVQMFLQKGYVDPYLDPYLENVCRNVFGLESDKHRSRQTQNVPQISTVADDDRRMWQASFVPQVSAPVDDARRMWQSGNWAGLGPNTSPFDVCFGIGTFVVTLPDCVTMFVGIEMDASAAGDANRNVEVNDITNCSAEMGTEAGVKEGNNRRNEEWGLSGSHCTRGLQKVINLMVMMSLLPFKDANLILIMNQGSY
ncbi:Methyltransferase domain-containing protein [Artemisia annua]|uniref:Methyltransferase domain-containing protein n=1 Tax=Artemisia annua TaxID=35608 RepID=A0A2U1L6W6_ARTAN|nr:Methyltransferase domain-containing protein [Artemisia annua]